MSYAVNLVYLEREGDDRVDGDDPTLKEKVMESMEMTLP